MKKFLLGFAALALSTSAFAQGYAPSVTFQAEGYDDTAVELSSVNSNIVITFQKYEEDSEYTPHLMVATGGGFEVNQEPWVLEPTPEEGTGKYVSVFSMNKSTWGTPYLGNFQATLMVYFENGDGEYLFNEEDEPVMFMQSYVTPNVFPAELLSVYPNNDWAYQSFNQAYDNGEIRFSFTNEISLETGEKFGLISYERFDGETIDDVEIVLGENAEAYWSYMDGCYTISINYALEGVSANEISEVDILLDELQSLGSTIKVDPVVLENDNDNMKRIAKQTTAAKGLAVSTETVSVYNLQGMLVKENIAQSEISTLPKGLYIVNGKKVVVK